MKMSYYPGCSLKGSARDYDESVRKAADLLEIELRELPDWNCCGASSAHMTDHDLALRLSARNLELAEREGLDVLVPCAACFQRLRAADYDLREGPGAREGETYSPGFDIVHLTAFLSRPEYLEKIRRLVKRPLGGFRLACYYGCLSLRPPEITKATEYEDPRGLDEIVKALDAEPLRWSHKTECCGGSLTMTRPDISRSLIKDIVDAAVKAGAEAIVTDCPMCHANLDSRQLDLAAGDRDQPVLPVFFATELIAAVLSEVVDAGWWKGHLVNPRVLVERLVS